MHDHIPRSAVETAIHIENQAASKEARGPVEGLRELWGAARETLGNIFDAAVDLFGEAARSIRHEADVIFFGRDTLPRQNETHHHGTVEVADSKQLTFDDLCAQQAAMLPPAEQAPEQAPSPTIDR